jgi:hypothetical protein
MASGSLYKSTTDLFKAFTTGTFIHLTHCLEVKSKTGMHGFQTSPHLSLLLKVSECRVQNNPKFND